MKLGVSYNAFDGLELLPYSIRSIRKQVDHIHVIYQKISNKGNALDYDPEYVMKLLKAMKYIDSYEEYSPETDRPANQNEVIKRTMGLEFSRQAGMTHHISLDCDEVFMPAPFKFIKEEMIRHDFDSSCCRLISFYKEPIYRLQFWDIAHVPLIYKIRPEVRYNFGIKFPPEDEGNIWYGPDNTELDCVVIVDPTRIMEPGKCRIFTPDELFVYHYSYVRRNLRMKLENSSSEMVNIEKALDHFEKWEYPQEALIASGVEDLFFQVTKVDNHFNIKI